MNNIAVAAGHLHLKDRGISQVKLGTYKEYDSCFVFQSASCSLVLLRLSLYHVGKPYINYLYSSVLTVKMARFSL